MLHIIKVSLEKTEAGRAVSRGRIQSGNADGAEGNLYGMETQVGLYFKKISEKLERQANCRRAQRDITFSQGKILWYLHRCEDEPVTLREHRTIFRLFSRHGIGDREPSGGKGARIS